VTKQVHDVHIPNIQRGVEFVVGHLNDPNFDLSQLPSSVVEEESRKRYIGEYISGEINFDE